MFYAPNLLSLKNKTEISIVYYISTTKKYRRINKRNASKINIENIINEIMKPKIPFSLRLYAYLLNGIVKIWLMKIEWFALTTKITKNNRSTKSRKKINRVLRNPNLVIEDVYLNDIEEINENPFYEINCNESINECIDNTINSIEMTRKQTESVNGYIYNEYVDNTMNSINSIEMARKQNSSIIITEPKIKNKIERIDEINTMTSHDMFNKKRKIISKIEFPVYLEGQIIDLMNNSKLNSKSNKNIEIKKNDYFEETENYMELNSFPNSIEEWRISDAKLNESRQSSEYNKEWEIEETSRSKKAQWFYNILVQASNGKIIIIQDKPFSEIIINLIKTTD